MTRKRKGIEKVTECCDLTNDGENWDEQHDEIISVPIRKNTRRQMALSLLTSSPVHVFTFSLDEKVCFTEADIKSLDHGSFLNDTVMDFYCRWIESKLESNMKSKVHIFSSYLYQKLLMSSDSKQTDREGLAKWTKDDIFEKDFLFFPICEKLHW